MAISSAWATRLSLLVLSLSGLGAVANLPPISLKGSKLYTSDGDQFFVKGVAYGGYNGSWDPLVDADQCETDAGLIKQLGANTVRVYGANGKLNHDACMQTFATQGIYVWLDISNVNYKLDAVSLPNPPQG